MQDCAFSIVSAVLPCDKCRFSRRSRKHSITIFKNYLCHMITLYANCAHKLTINACIHRPPDCLYLRKWIRAKLWSCWNFEGSFVLGPRLIRWLICDIIKKRSRCSRHDEPDAAIFISSRWGDFEVQLFWLARKTLLPAIKGYRRVQKSSDANTWFEGLWEYLWNNCRLTSDWRGTVGLNQTGFCPAAWYSIMKSSA